MQRHYIDIEDKFINGVKDDKITAIIFKECPVSTTIMRGDRIYFTKDNNNFFKYCVGTKVVQQNQLKKLDSNQFGFRTSELLIDELCNRFRYSAHRNNLYYIIFLSKDAPSVLQDIYNPEYDDTPWRD